MTPEQWGEKVAGPVVLLLIVWLLALLLWRVCNRSGRIYNGSFVVLIILMFVDRNSAELGKKQKQQGLESAYQQFDKESRKENQRRKREGQGLTPPDISQRLDALETISKAANDISIVCGFI